jgi:hypothetical protein
MSLVDEKRESSKNVNVLCIYAVASILLMVHMVAKGSVVWAIYFTLATFFYALDIKRMLAQTYGHP